METATVEERLTESPSVEVLVDEAVIEQLDVLYQMIRKSLVTTMVPLGDDDWALEAELDGDLIDRIADEADRRIVDLEQAAAFVQAIKKEDAQIKSLKELYSLLWKEFKLSVWRIIHGKKYFYITDRIQNYLSTHHAHRMTFLSTLLQMANTRRRRVKQAMTDGE